MKKIYLIQSGFYDKTNQKIEYFSNLFAVGDEITAKNDCRKYQEESNKFYENHNYKFVYRYEIIDYYDF